MAQDRLDSLEMKLRAMNLMPRKRDFTKRTKQNKLKYSTERRIDTFSLNEDMHDIRAVTLPLGGMAQTCN